MARINYKQLLESTRSDKFKLLSKDKDDPFFEICKDERIWMIMFAKTRAAIKTHFPDLFNENVFERLFQEAYWKDPITWEKKWKDPRSIVNDTLNEFREHLESYDIDWKRTQEYDKPRVKECNYCPVNGHELCEYKDNCQLRGDNMNGLIYLVKNKVNGKCYVGQTIRKWPKRKNNHINSHDFYSAIDNAIKKHGPENFKWEILEADIKSQKHLDFLEKFHIINHNSHRFNWGYNIQYGGNYRGKFSNETKKKMSNSKKGKLNPHWGKKLLRKTVQKMSKNRQGKYPGTRLDKNCIPENNPWQSRIKYNKKSQNLGYFPDPISASLVYQLVWNEIYGDV